MYYAIGYVGSLIVIISMYIIAFILITGFSFIKALKGFWEVFSIDYPRNYYDYEENYEDDFYEENQEIIKLEKGEKETKQKAKIEKSVDRSSPTSQRTSQRNRSEHTSNRKQKIKKVHVEHSNGNYVAPPITLLHENISHERCDNGLLEANSEKIKNTLANFGIPVEVVDCYQGATVTQYELYVDPNVKLDKIQSLTSNIMSSLAAKSVRIIAPIPGKSTVGIEVPNEKIETVYLRGLLETEEFNNSKSCLTVAIGEDVEGNAVIGDIASMPHLLIAGTTGSGKSVCLNSLLVSILFRQSPEDVRMVIIDPKMVEFTAFIDLPHLLIPVVTDMKKATPTLEWLVSLMDERYMLFQKLRVDNIKSYNELIGDKNIRDDDGNSFVKMPRILVVLDEFADLVMMAKTDIKFYVMRLGQKARAAGIHLILATQRPSAKMIDSDIKANIPGTIALKTASAVNSRVIIETGGAEKLLGNGDMLYDDSVSGLIRAQGAFVSKKELVEVTNYIKQNNPPVIYEQEVENIINNISNSSDTAMGNECRDELFEEAARYVVTLEKISVGSLQRKYRIGFNRAARLVEQLSDAGIVGTENGTKPREVITSEDEIDELLNSL